MTETQLWAYEKERRLQTHVIKSKLTEAGSPEQLQQLAEEIARVARTTFFEDRFGCFSSRNRSAVYVNMGPTNLWIREQLELLAQAKGCPVLASAVDSPHDPYTFVCIFNSADGETWSKIARKIWQRGVPSE
jgi:hypothetical protein